MSTPLPWLHTFLVAGIFLAQTAIQAPAAEKPAPPVRVILWFDTEDYLLPADDDATLRLAKLLTERKIRATFKMVGEKARTLERRGRHDVIAALKKHDIGYHSDFHSVHPTPTEYLADCGWLDGIAEFVRREGDGAADVRRIFGVSTLACYGQPGSSWGPQAVAALGQIGVAPHGIPCYVDEDSHIGMDGKPFWYAGALNVFRMKPNLARMELHEPEALDTAKTAVSAMVTRLQQGGGGLISIFYHPCEWVHTEFWDGVNFARGANPPRESWKAPHQRTAAETDAAFERFAAYVDHIKTRPGVKWITASELPELYPDKVRSQGISPEVLTELARRLQHSSDGLNYQTIGTQVFSMADQFELLTVALHQTSQGKQPKFPIQSRGLMGPDGTPASASLLTSVDGPHFRDVLADVFEFIQTQHRVPARVFIGPDAVLPADFLVAMANAWLLQKEKGGSPFKEGVALGNHPQILPEHHLAKETPALFGNWIIHRAGFRAPKLMEIARLQAWTLKPAMPLLAP